EVPFAAIVEAAPAAEIVEPIPMVEPMAEVMPAPAEAVPAAEFVPAPAEEAPAAPPMAAVAEAAPAAAPAAPGGKAPSVPPGSKPKLVVKRGQKIGFEFPIYPDDNYVGRSDEKPGDIDLEDQEP